MQNCNPEHLFDIKDIMCDVEKVIQKGLNKLLVNYIFLFVKLILRI
jgi:hypothetical protein